MRDVLVRRDGLDERFEEVVTINDSRRIVYHNGLGCLIDEGPKGKPFRKVYTNVESVKFTGEMVQTDAGEMELVLVPHKHHNLPV